MNTIKTNKRSFSFASLDITFSSFLSSEEIKTSKENWKQKIATDNKKGNRLKIFLELIATYKQIKADKNSKFRDID